MKVSVVIPAYNAGKSVAAAIESVLGQDCPRDAFEIIVSDNMSTDDTAEIVAGYPIEYVVARTRGPAAARNAGVEKARGEWLIFMDSDCVARNGWLDAFMKTFSEYEIHAAGGTIEPFPDDSPVSRYQSRDAHLCNQREKMGTGSAMPFITSGNAAYRRDVFRELGGFDETLYPAGEDVDLAWRLHRAGYKMKYIPDAVVMHRHQTDVAEFASQYARYGYAQVMLHRKHRDFPGWERELGVGNRYFNLGNYFALTGRILKFLGAPFVKDGDERWKLYLDVVRQFSFLAGKMAASIQFGTLNL